MSDNSEAKDNRGSPTGAAEFISAIDRIPDHLITLETEPAYDPRKSCPKAAGRKEARKRELTPHEQG